MRLLSLLTYTPALLLLQTVVSGWFLFDFFLARDSFTASTLWTTHNNNKTSQFDDEFLKKSIQVKEKHCQRNQEAIFDKVILIVIDALGSEFIPSIRDGDQTVKNFKMPFVEKLISEKKAMGYIAKAATPTVTMPRIKALLSGTIPSFVDIMYNLARDVSKFDQDNILRIIRAHNKSILFYGDDTWLSLFDRSMFLRSKETFSFYANDFISVDTNVTNEALPETKSTDWDYLILHYLGLDHIGHIFGSNKVPLIDNKLLEMDDVITNIYKNMADKTDTKTLLIVTGDHGMSSEGNHGGNSNLETETAIIFLPINYELSSHKRFNQESRKIKQIDFSNTIASIMALPSPILSKGVAIESLLDRLMTDQERITCEAFSNTLQLSKLMKRDDFLQSDERQALVKLFDLHLKPDNNDDLIRVAREYFRISRQIQEKLLETIANNSNPALIVISISAVLFLTLLAIRKTSIHQYQLKAIHWVEMYLSIIWLSGPIFMHGSTDFIESENIFWPVYSLSQLSILILFSIITNRNIIKDLEPLRVTLLVITLVLTSLWNNYHLFRQTLSNTVLTTIASIFMCNSMMSSSDINDARVKKIIVLTMSFGIFWCRIVEESTDYDAMFVINIQRIVMIALIMYTLVNLYSSKQSLRNGSEEEESVARFTRKLSTSWIALVFLLARHYNLLFIMANVILEASLNNVINTLKLSRLSKVLLYIHFANCAFYNQGNSNLFTTIDVRPAFYGQTEYNIYLSVPLVVISSFATQVYWYIKLFQRIQEFCNASSKKSSPSHQTDIKKNMMQSILELTVHRNFLSLSYYMYVCIVLKNHLFIWSVISPKLIYHFVSNNVILAACLSMTLLHHIKVRLVERKNQNKIVMV